MSTNTISVGSNPQIEIDGVGGDLQVMGWDRTEIEARSDDLPRLEQSGERVSVSSSSDLALSVPRGAILSIQQIGGDVRIEDLTGSIELSIVGGDAVLKNLSGAITLGGVIGGDVSMENVTRINMNAAGGHGGPDISAKIRRKMDEATRRAERKMREAEQKMRQVEMRTQNMERRMRHIGQPLPPRPPTPPRRWHVGLEGAAAVETRQPVSDEERMAILKMLQDKKITSEDAEKLLAALEGGE